MQMTSTSGASGLPGDYGRWTIIGDGARRLDRKVMRICRCQCGVERLVRNDALRAGATTSCGCYRRDCWSLAIGPDGGHPFTPRAAL
jgi:hypothetical protein